MGARRFRNGAAKSEAVRLNGDNESGAAIAAMRVAHAELLSQVASPVEFMEPALKLDIASRTPSVQRMIRHLHQSCLAHTGNFRLTTQYKLPYLTEAYLQSVDG